MLMKVLTMRQLQNVVVAQDEVLKQTTVLSNQLMTENVEAKTLKHVFLGGKALYHLGTRESLKVLLCYRTVDNDVDESVDDERVADRSIR